MGESGQKLAKWLLFLFNLVLFGSGITLIMIGAITQTDYIRGCSRPQQVKYGCSPFIWIMHYYHEFLPFIDHGGYGENATPVLLIVVGVIIILAAFFLGCCGAIMKSYWMLMTFAILLGIIFVLEFAGGIAGFVHREFIHNRLERNMTKSLANYNVSYNASSVDATNQEWDYLQDRLECCGLKGYKDWHTMTRWTNGSVPQSCCKDVMNCVDRNVTQLILNSDCNHVVNKTNCPIWTEGCLNKESIGYHFGVIGEIGIGMAFFQLFGIFLACYLTRGIKRGSTYK